MYYRYRGEDWYAQREIDGEQAYEKMRRAMEKADHEKARPSGEILEASVRKRPERRDRSGTMEPLILGGCPCGPNATRGLAELARLDGVNAGGFRQGLQDAPKQCGGGPTWHEPTREE